MIIQPELLLGILLWANNGLKSCQSYNGTINLLPPLCKYTQEEDRKQKKLFGMAFPDSQRSEILKMYQAGFSRPHVEVGIPDIAMGNAVLYSADHILLDEFLCL